MNSTNIFPASSSDDTVDTAISLHMAAAQGNLAIVKQLLDQGIDVNAKDDKGHTPLHWAAWNGCTDVVPILFNHGADVHAKDKDGNTPLHIAAFQGCVNLIPTRLIRDVGMKVFDEIFFGRLGELLQQPPYNLELDFYWYLIERWNWVLTCFIKDAFARLPQQAVPIPASIAPSP